MLDTLIKSMGEAFRAHRAAATDSLRPVLGGAFCEQLFGVSSTAKCPLAPFVVITRDRPHAVLSPIGLPPTMGRWQFGDGTPIGRGTEHRNQAATPTGERALGRSWVARQQRLAFV
ncbi:MULTISPECIES: hypothetical protein [unclassified Streptomyces]|uniref:hypothetical protein n=1 Tax=unclassified Streptomyces TaxID=2593676 RepID=UPI00224C9B24|nr:hypothetical protein [Streptomyces sp. NBC_01443]MCX4633468.1 hypothetical protein [Streptomyces sp. NBC_01443]WSW49780.1 hypothetical protein OG296_42910 [Streptomyces sp. NBC_01001]